ncbi:hypothetical protein [Stackebrandtia nassauensis]|uniref:DUF4878 domain-containing protein n=1 Tax=Stackebrandtia nassauensis (strain DSM 44728 / CIP 108903 / NRRL B-16338 / NBRC 102104 / LLR-40K-21) TaxID=446470 RepID=D3PUN3_STANL|nr:hypothetical protein [Stackebrandtia nassauensis]ADD43046.1 hypothetical protein Snas_3382 [Stackebrandtia nassauensis DSM 44728]
MTETPPEKKRLLARLQSPPHWTDTRKRLTVIGGVVAGVTVIAASVIVYSAMGSGPEGVVDDYLSELRSGDAEAALEYASSVDELTKASSELLVDKAMATDWEVTQLVRRHEEQDETATVDVTITAADKTSRQGRFHLDEKGPDGWRILNPLIKVDMSELPMEFVEFNGTIVEDSGLMWMFPGAYRAFRDSASLFELSEPTYVAVPSADVPEEGDLLPPETYLPVLKSGKDLDTEVNRQLADWIDECVKSKHIDPEGCPFSGAMYTDRGIVSIDDDLYQTEEVTWKVKDHPTVRLILKSEGFGIRTVEPGKLTISGTGTDISSSGEPVGKFKGDCGVNLDMTTVTLAEPMEFEFVSESEGALSYTCGELLE